MLSRSARAAARRSGSAYRLLCSLRRTNNHNAKHSPLCFSGPTSCHPFSTNTKPKTGEDHEKDEDNPSFVEASLRGTGQVIFLNSSTSGAIVLGGLAVADPYLATMALAGVTTSTLTASMGGLDRQGLGDGLYGYNGFLVGCSVSVFLHPLPATTMATMDLQAIMASPDVVNSASWALASTCMGASIAPYVSVGLKEAMGGVPQWTVAFNLVALGALLRTKPFAAAAAAADDEGSVTAAAEVATSSFDQLATMAVLEAPLRGISQIFVVDSSLTGAAIVGGTALYSPGLAGHLLLGSAVGSLTGYTLCSAPIDEITCGLWGYNSALTSMGVGAFFVHSPRTLALSMGGAAVTAGAFGAFKVVFGMADAPCLTLPFCAVMSGCYLLGRGGVQGLRIASCPHSPEKNE
jgi:urea transporter